jgi:hypothetical protein
MVRKVESTKEIKSLETTLSNEAYRSFMKKRAAGLTGGGFEPDGGGGGGWKLEPGSPFSFTMIMGLAL